MPLFDSATGELFFDELFIDSDIPRTRQGSAQLLALVPETGHWSIADGDQYPPISVVNNALVRSGGTKRCESPLWAALASG
jgi:hypothetical protein